MPITPETMLQQLRDIAEKKMAENGGVDYVYERPEGSQLKARGGDADCLYVHQTDMGAQPGCIVGHWAHQDHGIELGAFLHVEGTGAVSALHQLGIEGCSGVTEAASTIQLIASRVQSAQDTGTGWVKAVETVQKQYDKGRLV